MTEDRFEDRVERALVEKAGMYANGFSPAEGQRLLEAKREIMKLIAEAYVAGVAEADTERPQPQDGEKARWLRETAVRLLTEGYATHAAKQEALGLWDWSLAQ